MKSKNVQNLDSDKLSDYIGNMTKPVVMTQDNYKLYVAQLNKEIQTENNQLAETIPQPAKTAEATTSEILEATATEEVYIKQAEQVYYEEQLIEEAEEFEL